MDMQHGQAAWTSSMGMQRGHAAWICSVDMKHEMQQGHQVFGPQIR
jgi:hypothetical protein